MNEPEKPIEEFFLESLLKICFAGIWIVTAVDFYFTGLVLERSMIVNSAVIFAVVTAFLFYRYGYFKAAVISITFIITAAMFYQSIKADSITTSSMAVIMVVGFSYSVLLKGKFAVWLHLFTLLGVTVVFAWLASHPLRYGKPDATDIIVAGVTYGILYFVIAYSTRILKNRYDYMVQRLAEKNRELSDKAHEIETQNEELVQSQENLFQMNSHLESLVEARTREVKKQNEQLIKYAYSNAHHVRGPVARVLGLIQLSKMDAGLDFPFLFLKIEEQVVEIDQVVKSINKELQV
jgi:signal transduction histidine kinase